MNLEEYISSGILESYVLGDLSPTERQGVEQNLSLYPQLKAELTKIEEAQERLLMATAVQPRPAVKKKILDNLKARQPSARTIPIERSNPWRYLAAASVVIALASSYLAYNYWSKWKTVQADYNGLLAQNQQMAQDYNQVNERLDKIEDDIKVIDNPAFKRVVLRGTENAPQSLAYVYWNENTNEVFLSIQNMKDLAQENQYQLWAIVDGKPVDAGTFDFDPTGLIRMKAATKAAAFAITIEPRGGNATPTLSSMQALGNV